MKSRLLTILTTLSVLFAAGDVPQKELDIFRNDKQFHSIKVTNGLNIEHFEQSGVRIISGFESHAIPFDIIDSIAVRNITIPTLSFTFPEYPEAIQVWDKNNYINAVLDIDGYGVVEDVEGLELLVKGRGNSSWGLPKKPMRLKFEKRTSICGFKKAKSYVLLADYLDPTMMRNAAGLWLAQQLGVNFANSFQPCNVIINGNYTGLYLLTEKIGINSASVHIDKNEGILFEMSSEYDEPYKFRTGGVWNIPVMVKDPDFDELYEANPDGPTPDERFEMWKNDFIAAVDPAIDGVDISGFDIPSAVNYLLTMNVVKNGEIGYPKSVYIYKEKIGEKYKFGPVWDLDVAYNFFPNKTLEEQAQSSLWITGVLNMLCDNQDFKEAYCERFRQFEADIFPEMLQFIDYYARVIESSAKMNGIIWPEEYESSWYSRVNSFETVDEVKKLKDWLILRVQYLSERVNAGEI